MGAICTSSKYRADVARVIEIRDLPDYVHDALVAAAEAPGLSLTRYPLRELDHIAKRAELVRHNAAVIRQTQAQAQAQAQTQAQTQTQTQIRLRLRHRLRSDPGQGAWRRRSQHPAERPARGPRNSPSQTDPANHTSLALILWMYVRSDR